MGAFSGTEPLVGEIVGLRTFRVDESGLLLPLYSSLSWYDGPNTAECAPPTGDKRESQHPVPAPNCECGFYAYGTEQAMAHQRQSRYVQAVVSCWGGVVAGTEGIRAEHARIDAIWLHPNATQSVRRRVMSRYPSARMYDDKALMLAEHPLSVLPCYHHEEPRHPRLRFAAEALGAALIALGALPLTMLHAVPAVWDIWLITTAAVGMFAAWMWLGSRETGHRAAAWVLAGVLAWLVAPWFGTPGWLLRVPLLRGLLFAVGGYLIAFRPHFFPVEQVRKERPFCGIRA